ncbi:NDP-hexose 2,3-dehydratase family protein [Woeseiaceae bacterium]|nr:NDP-hexose 2,3-dehydratase family protein [Woeseiaceae bacterium]
MAKSEEYRKNLEKYLEVVSSFSKSDLYENTLESSFESLNDWSLHHSLAEVKNWFRQKREDSDMEVTEIPLNELVGWGSDESTGNISHESNDFFIVRGLRIHTKSREVASGWEQPILEQVGYDGGLLGIVRQRFSGVPHYLCEAKMEPGNYGKVQLSPSLQATFANIAKSHGGRRPHFLEIFENLDESSNSFITLFDAWLAEDGGRLYLKRNRGMLVEVPENYEIKIPNSNFIWLSLYQIKILLSEDAWVNPHIRGILAHV